MKVLAAITDEKERLLRQVNPSFVRAGRPSSKVFEPKPKDEGLLSVCRESLRPAAAAYEFFIKIPKCKSVGVLAVTVGDCAAESLPAHDAPLTAADDGIDDHAHSIINYNGVTPEQIEEKAIALHRAALGRGYVHQPAAPAALPTPATPASSGASASSAKT